MPVQSGGMELNHHGGNQNKGQHLCSRRAIDYDVRTFHGYETPYGATYNSYLIIDDKISLIDFVKAPFTDELKTEH